MVNTTFTSGRVEVEGAEIYFERRGRGPPLLMISGGGGDAGFYAEVAERLADQFLVLTYDRRGNSRSSVRNPQAELRIEEQSDDAIAVLKANDLHAALLFGNSGGALIGLDLAARFPAVVSGLVAHEPPVISVLPDKPELSLLFQEIDALNRQQGPDIAMRRFGRETGMFSLSFLARHVTQYLLSLLHGPVKRLLPPRDVALRLQKNNPYFISQEMMPFIRFTPDFSRLLAHQCPMVIAGGRESRGLLYYRAGQVIAQRLGVRFLEFPGHHLSYVVDPHGFAARLRGVLSDVRASA